MVNRDFKCTFKDGSEYEVRLYHLGGIKIRDEFGAVLFDNGLYVSQDIAEILDRFKDELKATDRMYDNPMESIEEVERMELDQGEIMKVLNDGADEFMDLELFSDWSEEEKENTRRFLVEFYNVWAVSSIMKAEIVKLNKMAEEEVEE